MTIRFPPQTWGYSPMLQQYGGSRIPFELVDRNRTGTVQVGELAGTVMSLFPGLRPMEAEMVAREAQSRLGGQAFIGPREWQNLESHILDVANNMLQTRTPAGWAFSPNIPVPFNDGFMDPRLGMPGTMLPGGNIPRPIRGAAQVGVGLAKQIPGLGNILNGGHVLVDLMNMTKAIFDPRKTMGDVFMSGLDAIVHTIGAVPVPGLTNLAGGYDVLRGAGKMVAGPDLTDRLNGYGNGYSNYLGQLPPFAFDQGNYPLAYGNMPNALLRGSLPYGFETGAYRQPLMWGRDPYAMNYRPGFVPGVPFENWASPEYRAVRQADSEVLGGAAQAAVGVGKAALGAGKALGLGFLKSVPLLGNVINGAQLLWDVGKLVTSFGNPQANTAKIGMDLVAHAAGMFFPWAGAAYDVAMGLNEVRVNDASKPSTVLRHMSRLPEFQFPTY